MERMINALSLLTTADRFLVFLGQNLLVFLFALLLGYSMLSFSKRPGGAISKSDWRIAVGTVFINTLVTYAGYALWQNGWIRIRFGWSAGMISDFLILFFAMDFLMYVFHWLIHYSFLHRYIHELHHEAIDPKPIDLFVLHPVETLAFGGLWLSLLLLKPFNMGAILFYLLLNVVFGIVGHLGTNGSARPANRLLQLLGTSRFHHAHHRNIHCNFGFYTSLWDRLFGTFSIDGGKD